MAYAILFPMKHWFKYLCSLLVILFLCGEKDAYAQLAVPENWDQDIYTLRHMGVPGYQFGLDDYTQYAPAAVMLALQTCGYQGRSGWGPMLVADAFSVAAMTVVVRSVKASVDRIRPNGSGKSFPSGHTATAFMTATMLYKEYGWKSPWWSIGGYTLAAFTGVSRILNNWHWMSDVATGAAIGIGSVHLGYYLSDLIFKGKYMNSAYDKPVFGYDPAQKHYVAELLFGRRFFLGGSDLKRGGLVGLSTDIPFVGGVGVTVRAAASSLTDKTGLTGALYSTLAGGYYNLHFARRFEAQARAMAGLGWYAGKCGTDLSAGMGLSFFLDENFKVKAFAEYETVRLVPQKPWMHSFVLGWSSAWSF